MVIVYWTSAERNDIIPHKEVLMITYEIQLRIERLAEGPFLGTSPDLPGLIVQADSPAEVLSLAPEIARDLIQVMSETGQPLPAQLRPHTGPVTVRLPVFA